MCSFVLSYRGTTISERKEDNSKMENEGGNLLKVTLPKKFAFSGGVLLLNHTIIYVRCYERH
jgi:hypothetical protein